MRKARTMAAGDVERYVDNLIFALRMRNVPGERIGEIVAELEAHIAESGEDPADAFGKPREYARTWAREAGHRSSWPERIRSVLGVVAAGLGGALLGVGGVRTSIGETVWGYHAIVAVLVGLVLFAVPAFSLPKSDRVIDPRTGREPERIRRAGRRAMLVTGIAVVAWVAATMGMALVFA